MKDKASDFIKGEDLDVLMGSVVPAKKGDFENSENKDCAEKKEVKEKRKKIIF